MLIIENVVVPMMRSGIIDELIIESPIWVPGSFEVTRPGIRFEVGSWHDPSGQQLRGAQELDPRILSDSNSAQVLALMAEEMIEIMDDKLVEGPPK